MKIIFLQALANTNLEVPDLYGKTSLFFGCEEYDAAVMTRVVVCFIVEP
ncbi:unnamed protein product [Brassica rapa subsp. trilocularis]